MVSSLQFRKKFRIKNRFGLHATPAALIVKILNKYPAARVWVRNANGQVNGKSIMGLITLEARCNTELLFVVGNTSKKEGEVLINELSALFENKFFED